VKCAKVNRWDLELIWAELHHDLQIFHRMLDADPFEGGGAVLLKIGGTQRAQGLRNPIV
jgi:hypothetical protein